MNFIRTTLAKLRRVQFSLSSRIILSMAGMVFLTALASVVIFNIIITNKTHDLENNFQKTFAQIQDYRKQNQTPPQQVVERLKTTLDNSTLSPETQIDQIRGILRNSDTSSYGVIRGILRDAGLPVSEISAAAETDTNQPQPPPNGGDPLKALKISPRTLEQQSQWWIFSPVIQASLLGSLIAAVCAVLLGFVISRTVIRPLRQLEQASERIADGNYSLEVGPEGRDDLGRLARSFNKMARTLLQTERKRKELVADVAHELRTPLSSIQGYTEVLRDGLVTSQERQTEIHNHILKEVRQLTTMVESMRVWMSNEQALEHLNIEDVPVQLAPQMVAERFRPAAEQKGINLVVEANVPERPELMVRADSDALAHILSNLVDNSLRYTPEGGAIQLKISGPVKLPNNSQKVIWFEVKDNGSGIPAEHLPFVFERFYRVDKSRDRTTGGTGLGLAIVRDTVVAMGGEVQIKSEIEVGTTISFWLPAAGSQTASSGRKLNGVLVGSRS